MIHSAANVSYIFWQMKIIQNETENLDQNHRHSVAHQRISANKVREKQHERN